MATVTIYDPNIEDIITCGQNVQKYSSEAVFKICVAEHLKNANLNENKIKQ
jgi:hypothetical protein